MILTRMMIVAIASGFNLDFIDLRNDVRSDHQTIDGMYLNAAGYNQWREAVLSTFARRSETFPTPHRQHR
jgi:hypothetical protein